MMSKYLDRGVSSKKEDVHDAVKNMDRGIFPGAFCKVVEDFIAGDPLHCNVMHADGAGTKSSLAYIYYRETGDLSVFRGIVQDAVAMNTDDLLCVGACDNFILSNTIGRNPKYIGKEVVGEIILGFSEISGFYKSLGINVVLTGGETADVADLVRTLIVDSTVIVRLKKSDVIDNSRLKPGLVIVGLSSSGRASYEKEYNSGIGSNGLTSARHDILNGIYKAKYPESYNTEMPPALSYTGRYKLTDAVESIPLNIGKALLSPTRTYAPLIKEIMPWAKEKIFGMIHCTGGGQTKCLKFGRNIHYVKKDMFEIPPIFKLINESAGSSLKEMYEVFNMGHRLEIFTDEKTAEKIIATSRSFDIGAKIIGLTEKSNENKLTIHSPQGIIEYF